MYDDSIVALINYESGDALLLPWFFVRSDAGISQTQIGDFDPTETYSKNDIVKFNDELYHAKDGVTPAPWDVTKWQIISIIRCYVNNHKTYLDYELDCYVLKDDVVYKNNVATFGEFVSDQWDEVGLLTTVEHIYGYTSAGVRIELTGLTSRPDEILGLSTDPNLPTPNSMEHTYFMYYPSWATEAFELDDVAATLRKPSNMPDYVTHTMLSFARPQGFVFDKDAPDIAEANTGLQFPEAITPEILKQDIGKAQSNGQKVLLSVGGATYSRPAMETAWDDLLLEGEDLISGTAFDEVTHDTVNSLIEFLEYFELDGMDLEFEDTPAQHADWTAYMRAYYVLLWLMDFITTRAGATLNKSLKRACACWSTGFDQTAASLADLRAVHEDHGLASWYGDAAGRDRLAFGGYTDPNNSESTLNHSDLVDIYILMTYDVMMGNHFTEDEPVESKFDPVVVYQEARAMLPGGKTVALGLIAGDHGHGDHICMLKNSHCATEGPHETLLELDQYSRVINAPYSVERLCSIIRNDPINATDGALMWMAYKDMGSAAVYSHNGTPAPNVTAISREVSAQLGIGTDTTSSLDIT